MALSALLAVGITLGGGVNTTLTVKQLSAHRHSNGCTQSCRHIGIVIDFIYTCRCNSKTVDRRIGHVFQRHSCRNRQWPAGFTRHTGTSRTTRCNRSNWSSRTARCTRRSGSHRRDGTARYTGSARIARRSSVVKRTYADR